MRAWGRACGVVFSHHVVINAISPQFAARCAINYIMSLPLGSTLRLSSSTPDVFVSPWGEGHYAMIIVVRLSVCLSVPCLTVSRQRKGIGSWKLARKKRSPWVTVTQLTGQRSRSPGRLTLRRKMHHIFGTGRPTNFKLGVRMEYHDPHHRRGRWSQRSKVKVTRRLNDLDGMSPLARGGGILWRPPSQLVTRCRTRSFFILDNEGAYTCSVWSSSVCWQN